MDEDTKGSKGFRAFAVRVQEHMTWYSLNAPWVIVVGGMAAGVALMATFIVTFVALQHWAHR
jgi:hypothetical protein